MAGPAANVAALRYSASPDVVFEDLSGNFRGWKKKMSVKETGTPKRKVVSYVAPNGEEIKSRRHIDKYLKAHPGVLRAGDFCWTSGEAPRRSLRLNRKGRHIRFQELEMLPRKRRKGNNHSNAKHNRSPVLKICKGRKSGGSAGKSVVAGKDEVMLLAVKAEPVADIDILEPLKEPQYIPGSILYEDKVDAPPVNMSLENMKNGEPDSEEVVELKGADSFEDHRPMDVDVVSGIDGEALAGILLEAEEVVAPDIPVREAQREDAAAEFEETNVLTIASEPVEADNTTEASVMPAETADTAAEPHMDDLAGGTFVCNTLPADGKEDLELEGVDEPNPDVNLVEEIWKEEIIGFISEEPLETEKANAMDVDTFVDDTTTVVRGEETESKEVDPPQPQGIHALVNDMVTFGGKAPQEDEVCQASLEVSRTVLEPIVLST